MTREQMTAFFARRLEAMNRHDVKELTRHHTEGGIVDSPLSGGISQGLEEIEKSYTSIIRVFPDVKLTQEWLLIDGNRAVFLLNMSGSGHVGLMGLPPATRAFSVPIVFLDEFENGLIARERRIYDFTGLLLQIGVLKAKPV
jgi:predicted ester cyclase